MLPVVCYRSPLWPRYHSIWFKTYIMKDNCPFKLLLGQKGKKIIFHHFRLHNVQYTYIHKTNTCWFFFPFYFLHLSLRDFLLSLESVLPTHTGKVMLFAQADLQFALLWCLAALILIKFAFRFQKYTLTYCCIQFFGWRNFLLNQMSFTSRLQSLHGSICQMQSALK